MSNRDEYDIPGNTGHDQRGDIGFDDRAYDDRGYDDRAYDDYGYDNRGDADGTPYYDYDDAEYDRYDDDRYPRDDSHYPTDGYYPREEQRDYYYTDDAPRGRHHDTSRDADRDGYRAGYRDGFRDNNRPAHGGYDNRQNNEEMESNRKESFRKRHPIVMHLLYAACATVLAIWMALWFLDFWTFHGQERAVPDVKGQSLEMAEGNISRAGLRAVVTDSVYDSYARPGTVVEQSPIPLANIKRGGTVYLTLVAFTPKMVTIPDFYDVSERQARSMLEGLGITQVMTVNVPSEYAGLVLGARFNGVSLRPGAKVPVTAVITLEVGGGMADVSPTDDLVDTLAIEQTIEALNID